MPRWLTQLRKSGGLIGLTADLLALLMQNWGLVVSAIVALGAGLWSWAYKELNDPHVETAGRVFLWALWSYIGVSILYRLHVGIKTIPTLEYSHCIILEGIVLGYDKDSEDAALQIMVMVRNVGNGPIKVQVHDFRVILEGRTIPDSPMIEMIIPRIGPKGIMSGTFKKDVIADRGEGTIDLLLHYGDPDGEPTRKFRIKAKIYVKVGDSAGVSNNITFEQDVPL